MSPSVRELTVGCPSSIKLQRFGKPKAVIACIKAIGDAILQIVTVHKASDPQVATKVSEWWLIEALKHIRSTFSHRFIQPRILQVLMVRNGLFSSSNVQMENHRDQFVPKRSSIVWTRPNSFAGFAPYGA